MNVARFGTRFAAVCTSTVMAAAAVAAPAQAVGTAKPLGTRSLAAVLTQDTGGFDRNARDFDILTAAALAVLEAKPDSPVTVLTDGTVALTAFVPNDGAFQR